MKQFFTEMFQEDNGGYSMLRTLIIGCFVIVFSVWSYVSLSLKSMVDIPAGVVTLLMAMLTAKVWQKNFEQKNNTTQG